MERQDEHEELIELGTASTETKGPMGDMIEPIGLWRREGMETD